MNTQRFIPKRVFEGEKEIGEALEFSDGSIAIRLFKENGRMHVLNLVPVQKKEGARQSMQNLKKEMKTERWAGAISDAASMEVAEKYHCPLHQNVVGIIVEKLSKLGKSSLIRENVVSTIKSVLFQEGVPVSRTTGYLMYLSKKNILCLMKKGRKGEKKSQYFFNPFYKTTGEGGNKNV